MKLKTYILIAVLMFAGTFAYAAPSFTVSRTVLPEVTNTYDLGSLSKLWNNLFVTNLTVATTTGGCAQLSSTGQLFSTGSGCGTSAGSWSTTSSAYYLSTIVNPLTVGSINATSTTASSTFSNGINLVNGCYSINNVCIGSNSGTVTSIAATVPSFLSVSGSPITGAGTLAITLSGTALPVANGGTGQTAFGQGWLGSDGTTITSSTSPTVNYITATSTTATTTINTGGFTVGSTAFIVEQNSDNTSIGTTPTAGVKETIFNTSARLLYLANSGVNTGVGTQDYQFISNHNDAIGDVIIAQRNASASGEALNVQQLGVGTGLKIDKSNALSATSGTGIDVQDNVNTGIGVNINRTGNSASAINALVVNASNAGAGAAYSAIFQTGLVGVGTSTPFSTLSVNTSAGTSPFSIGSSTGSYLFMDTVGNLGIASSSPWKLLSVGNGNKGTFAISTSTSGCATFSSFGELYSTGSTCGTSSGLTSYDAFTHPAAGVSATTSEMRFASTTSFGQFLTNNIVATDTNATSTFANPLKITANKQTGNSNWGLNDGTLNINNTNSNGIGFQLYSNNGSAVGPDVLLEQQSTSFAQTMLYIDNKSTNAASAGIRINHAGFPAIVFVDTTSDNTDGAGKYQFASHNNLFRIEGRDITNGSFIPDFVIGRDGATSTEACSYGRVGLFTGFGCGSSRFDLVGTSTLSNLMSLTSVTGATTGDILKVLQSGNVGIGSSTPGSLLSLGTTGGINFNPTATSTFGSSANGINITNGCYAINGTCLTSGSGTNYWTLNGTNNIYNNNAGLEVGIGTSSPVATLHIGATSASVVPFRVDAHVGGDQSADLMEVRSDIGSNYLSVSNSGVLNAYQQIQFTGPTYGQFQDTTANASLDFKTVAGLGDITFTPNATQLLNLNHSGNVGISTTSPGTKFSINAIANFDSATSTIYNNLIIGAKNINPVLTIGSTTPTYGYLANDRFNIIDSRNDYTAGNIYNLSANNCATADWTVANDLNSTALNFGDFGHTSSGFTGVGCANNPFTGFGVNSTYLFDPSGNMNFAIGSTTAGAAFNWFGQGYAASNILATLTNMGKFGIGTSSPKAILSLQGLGASDIFTVTTAGGLDIIKVLSGGTIQFPQLNTAGTLITDSSGNVSVSTSQNLETLGFTVDAGSSVITAGLKGSIMVPYSATIQSVTVLSTDPAATSGTITVDIYKTTYANYPNSTSSITSLTPPKLTAAQKYTDSTLTGWTKTLSANDVLEFNATSTITSVKRVTVILTVKKN